MIICGVDDAVDLTRSIQHKHERSLKSHAQENLLAELEALPRSHSVGPPDSAVDPLDEPFPTLPLWRRVNRQFWWNEWPAKPFIDAGVGTLRKIKTKPTANIRPAAFVCLANRAGSLPNILLRTTDRFVHVTGRRDIASRLYNRVQTI